MSQVHPQKNTKVSVQHDTMEDQQSNKVYKQILNSLGKLNQQGKIRTHIRQISPAQSLLSKSWLNSQTRPNFEVTIVVLTVLVRLRKQGIAPNERPL